MKRSILTLLVPATATLLAGIAVLPVLAIAGTTISPPVYQWHTFFGGDGSSNYPATAVDASGNLYLTGGTQHPWDNAGNPGAAVIQKGYVVKIGPTGQLLWSRFFDSVCIEYGFVSLAPSAIAIGSGGHIYIAGRGNISNTGCATDAELFVAELDSGGNLLGTANFGGPTSEFGHSAVTGIAYDPAANVAYVTGSAVAWDLGYQGYTGWTGGTLLNSLPITKSMFTMQVVSGSALGWVGFYSSSGGPSYGSGITVDGSSNIYVAGSDDYVTAVWKISSTGSQAWEFETKYSNNSLQSASLSVATYGGNVYVAGYTYEPWNGPAGQVPLNALVWRSNSDPQYGYNAFVLKLDTGGNYVWHTFYPGNQVHTVGYGIAVGGSTEVYVAGRGDLVGYNNAAPQHDTASTGGGGHFILQLDGSGAYQWHSLYGLAGYSSDATSIALDPQDNVFVSGWSGVYNGFSNWTGDNDTSPLHSSSGASSSVFAMKFGPTAASAATTTTAGSPAPLTYSLSDQNVTVSATVTSTSTVNSGTVSFTLLGKTVSGNVGSGWASASALVPGGTQAGSYTLQATYNPGTGFATSSDSSEQLTIGKATPVIAWSNPADIVYGAALGSTQLNATAGVAGAFLYAPPAGTVLQAGPHQTLSTTFTPTDTTDYTTAATSVLINVSKATPVITWSNPADISVGTALSSTQLNATANVAGAFVYAPPAGTVLSLGNAQTLSTTFTPTDTTDYTTAVKSVLINVVAKATPVITWSNPAGIVYGTALGSTQLNATANVPGAFVYAPPAGTVLQAGTGQTLSTTFTPTDTADYTTATKSVLIDVSKATPVITWAAPAPITYGGALGNGQLNASSAGVAGTFVYTPPAGTVLPVGNGQTLSVTFTPTDAADYTTAAASTTINVNAAPSPPSGINLVVTKVLTRTGGNVVVQLTVSNTGGTPANNVTLTSVKVGSLAATPLPQNVGTIGASASAQAIVSVPGSVGASGAASSLTAAGTYTGGTFSLSMRITLP